MLNIAGITDALKSHAQTSGYFETVLTHEPKSAPGSGLTAVLIINRAGPYPAGSGQSITTGLLVFTLRVYGSMLAEPQDEIDMNMIEAVDAMFGLYSGDFTLGGKVREIDLLGQSGQSLSVQAGYTGVDNKVFRIMDINIPLIVNDLWSQSP